MKKLSIENPFFEWMSNIADLVMLNLVWIITCIPIFTIGAAQTALYRIMMRRARGECSYPIREYLTALKEDFVKSTKIWMILLTTGAVLIFDLMYMGQIWTMWGIAIGVLIFIWMILAGYVFPLTARFDNTCKNTWKNAAYMAVRFFPYTIMVVLMNSIPIVCILVGGAITQATLPIYLVFGFSLTVRINTILFQKMFSQYIE